MALAGNDPGSIKVSSGSQSRLNQGNASEAGRFPCCCLGVVGGQVLLGFHPTGSPWGGDVIPSGVARRRNEMLRVSSDLIGSVLPTAFRLPNSVFMVYVPFRSPGSIVWSVLALTLLLVGCGTTRQYTATEQLVMSAAVDRSIGRIDFRPLSGSKVYLDTSYLRHVKGDGFVNAEYVISALRQQIVAAGCLIQDSNSEADIVIEARIGTLGQDDHRVTFGLPETNMLAAAAALIPGAPSIPTVGEIAFARREAREAAAKVAAFAYDRKTRTPIWQSGVDSSLATATDTWVMGIGPFQGGTVREQTQLAGSSIKFGEKSATGSPAKFFDRPPVDYTAEVRFQSGQPVFEDGGVTQDMLGVYQQEIAKQLELVESGDQIADKSPKVAAGNGEPEIGGPNEKTEVAAADSANEVAGSEIQAGDAGDKLEQNEEAESGTEVAELENGTEVAKAVDSENEKNLK